LLLHYPVLEKDLNDLENLTKLGKLNLPYMELFIWLIYLLRDEPGITGSGILERCKDSTNADYLARSLVESPLISEDSLKSEFLGIIHKLDMRADESIIESLMQKARRGELNNNEKLVLQELIKKTKC